MKISSKGRYALVSMIYMARNYDSGKHITVIKISEKFSISKIYLEQIFSLLKKGNLVTSIKGAQGGYQLSRSPKTITVYDILYAIENVLFDTSEDTVLETAPAFEKTIRNLIFDKLDNKIFEFFSSITLHELLTDTQNNLEDFSSMYYI